MFMLVTLLNEHIVPFPYIITFFVNKYYSKAIWRWYRQAVCISYVFFCYFYGFVLVNRSNTYILYAKQVKIIAQIKKRQFIMINFILCTYVNNLIIHFIVWYKITEFTHLLLGSAWIELNYSPVQLYRKGL